LEHDQLVAARRLCSASGGLGTSILIGRLDQRSTRREAFLNHPERDLIWGVALFVLVAFFALLIPVGPLRIDSRWSELMQDIQEPWLKQIALVFNALGRGWSWVTIAGIGLLLVAGRRWLGLVAFALTEAVTPALVALMKALVDRPRPPGQLIYPHGSSFPSGHAAYASATTIALVLLFTNPGRTRSPWIVAAVVLSAGMAWSRTYLQVHWLSDVIAGALLGLAVTLTSFATVQRIDTRRRFTLSDAS
jgi:undecaprenyl-diphosphatase